jgi:hypothetical protein
VTENKRLELRYGPNRGSWASGNLLPGVRVALTRAKAVTHTDGNGRFSLAFRLAQSAAKDKDGAYDHLELDKEGYEGRVIKIEDLAYFAKPVALGVSPIP